jgi:hypothetical protein
MGIGIAKWVTGLMKIQGCTPKEDREGWQLPDHLRNDEPESEREKEARRERKEKYVKEFRERSEAKATAKSKAPPPVLGNAVMPARAPPADESDSDDDNPYHIPNFSARRIQMIGRTGIWVGDSQTDGGKWGYEISPWVRDRQYVTRTHQDGAKMFEGKKGIFSVVCGFLEGVPWRWTGRQILRELFKHAKSGGIIGFHLMRKRSSRSYMGTGFVQFRDSRDLTRCMASMKVPVGGVTMWVSGSHQEFWIEAMHLEQMSCLAPRISLYGNYNLMFNSDGGFDMPSPMLEM